MTANGTAEQVGWQLKIGYVPRFGWLQLQPQCPHGGAAPKFNVPLTGLLRETKIAPEALRAHAVELERPELPGAGMTTEELCDSLIGDCTGKTVLDIGGYDGRAAAKALENGAADAICIDNRQWERYGWPEPEYRDGVDYAFAGCRDAIDFMDWDAEVDVVLFFNVLYHCEDPRGALAHLRSITRERMLLCSLVVWDDRPVWYPHEEREVNEDDPTVYWSPSDAGLKKLLKATGWSEVREVGKTTERLVLECRP